MPTEVAGHGPRRKGSPCRTLWGVKTVSCTLTCSLWIMWGRRGARLSLAYRRRGREPLGDEPPKCFSARAAIEGTLQIKGHDAVSAPTGGHRASALLWA
jgi:hypothetical protein